MKKLLSSTALILCIAAMSFSSAQAQGLDFGIRGGLNFASITDAGDSETRTGFMVGVYTNLGIPMSPITIQPEVLYTQKGVEQTLAGETITTKLDYIEIPVSARFNIMTPGPVSPHIYAGPYLGFNVNAEVEGGGETIDVDDSIKDTDFGFTVGGGVDFSKFNVGVRYNRGFSDVGENGGGSKNSVFSIVAGLNF